MTISRRLASISILVAVVLAAIGSSSVAAATSQVRLIPILSGYERPLGVTSNGRKTRVIFIVEQVGRISRATYRNGAWRKQGTFLDVSDKIALRDGGELGLLGLAFHPNYHRNGRFYISYTRAGDGDDRGDLVIAEYRRRNAARASKASERVVMVIDKPSANHSAGNLEFGPDGLLYISVGDGGGHQDPDGNGQNKGTLLGSILRIDPRDPDGAGPRTYRIPRSNPFVGRAGRNEIWAYGFRNPWQFAFDAFNGNLWIFDVGEDAREEVDKARSDRFGRNAGRGKNYGWSDCEGSLEFKLDEGDPDDECSTHTLPLFDYAIDRADGTCSVIGGHVHRGIGARAWRGLFVGGDLCGRLFVLDQKGRLRWTKDRGTSLASFGQDSAGRFFATGIGDGTVYLVRMVGPRPTP